MNFNRGLDKYCTILYYIVRMIQVNISQARQTLPTLVDKVYRGEEYVIVKNRIPVAQLVPLTKKVNKIAQKRIISTAIRLFSHLKGSNIKIANELRESAWRGKYGR